MKIYNNFLIKNKLKWNIIISLLAIGFLVSLLLIINFINPFPQRYFYNQLDTDMLENGEGLSLILIYTFAFIFVILYSISFVFTLYTNFFFFKRYKLIIEKNKSISIFIQVLLILLCLINAFLFGLLNLILILIIILRENNKLNIIKKRKITKKFQISWIMSLTSLSTIFLGTFATIFINSPKEILDEKVNQKNINKYYTISNNKHNVLFYYFDRVQGALWNSLLLIDKIINPNNNFIDMFPEFTSYTNTISLSDLTVLSNPSIYSGPYFSSWLKNTNELDNFNNKNFSEITQNDFYYNSFKELVKMLNKNKIKNVSFNNIPYYGNSKTGNHGNVYELENDLKTKDNLETIGISNNFISNNKYNTFIKNFDDDNICDLLVLDNMAKDIIFDNTNTGVYQSLFSQACHVPYAYKLNNKYHSTMNDNGLVWSSFSTIEILKGILTRLKNEPFLVDGKQAYDKNNNPISVYDKTAFFIVSDHGYNTKNVSEVKRVYDELLKNKIISQDQYDTIINFDFHKFNPLIKIKNFKYDIDNNIIDQNLINKQFFDNDKIIALSDAPFIMKNYLNKYLKIDNDSSFIPENNKFNNHEIKNIINNQLLLDPLNENFNSIKNNKIINREFLLPVGYGWKFKPDKINFDMSTTYYIFKMNKESKNIFDNKNFIKNKKISN